MARAPKYNTFEAKKPHAHRSNVSKVKKPNFHKYGGSKPHRLGIQKGSNPRHQRLHVVNSAGCAEVRYFDFALQRLSKGFNSVETKEHFMNNVFDELIKSIVGLVADCGDCDSIAKLISMASREQLQRLLETVINHFQSIAAVEQFTALCKAIVLKALDFFDDDAKNAVMNLLCQLGEIVTTTNQPFHLVNHVSDCIWDVMARGKGESSQEKEDNSETRDMKEVEYYSMFSDLLLKFSDRVLPKSPSDLAMSFNLLDVCSKKHPKFYAECCQKVAESEQPLKEAGGVPNVYTSIFGSRFSVLLINGMSTDLFDKFFDKHIVPHLNALLGRDNSEHVICTVINRIHSDDQFAAVLQCMKGKLFYCLQPSIRKANIVSRFCDLAAHHPSWQTAIMDAWGQEMRKSSTNFVVAVCLASPLHHLTPKEVRRRITMMSALHSLTLQAMAKYEDTAYLSSSYKELPVDIKLALANCKPGSYCLAALLNSPTVPSEVKTNFLATPKEFVITLATGKNSYNSFFRFWTKLVPPMQMEVASLLATSVSEVTGSKSGKKVAADIRLQDYIDNRDKWEQWLVKKNGANKMLNIGETEDSPPVVGQLEITVKKEAEIADEHIKEETIPVVKKKKRAVATEDSNAGQEVKVEVLEETPAKKSRKITKNVSTPAKKAATPAASAKKSKKNAAKLSEDAQATEEVMSTPAAAVLRSAKKTKSAKKKGAQ